MIPNNFTNYADTFGIKKQTYSFNCKFGYQYVKKKFTLDVYAGVGARYKVVNHYDRLKPQDEMEIPRHPNPYYISSYPGKYWVLVVPLNISIGWRF